MFNITPDSLKKQRELAHKDKIRKRVKEIEEAIKIDNANGETSCTVYLDKDVASANFDTVLTTSSVGLYTPYIKW